MSVPPQEAARAEQSARAIENYLNMHNGLISVDKDNNIVCVVVKNGNMWDVSYEQDTFILTVHESADSYDAAKYFIKYNQDSNRVANALYYCPLDISKYHTAHTSKCECDVLCDSYAGLTRKYMWCTQCMPDERPLLIQLWNIVRSVLTHKV